MNKTAEQKTIHLGAFDAEQFWRSPSAAQLPHIPDAAARKVVLAMEELQFLFCRKGDVLLTRYPLLGEHMDYLNGIGFSFQNNAKPIDSGDEKPSLSTVELLSRQAPFDFLKPGMEVDPYAVLPALSDLCDAWKLPSVFPRIDIVKRVNSKLYSCRMRERVGISNIAVMLDGAEELAAFLEDFPEGREYLLKEEFGVSGLGNLRIQSKAVGERILKHFRGQEKKGLSVRLIAEPFLDRESDFSCQFLLTPQGGYSLISVQKIWNTGLAYQGSVTPDASFLERLEKQGYFKLMEQVGRELFRDGYYGHVCVDSMVLKDGSLEPIVEINARKSMSLMKHMTDRYLESYGLVGVMTYLPVQGLRTTSFEEVLERLSRDGLLFFSSEPRGILPLSGNMLLANQPSDGSQRPFKGKFYLCASGESIEAAFQNIERVKGLLPDCGLRAV